MPDNCPTGRTGLYNQQAKVNIAALPPDRLLRSVGECRSDEVITLRGEDTTDCEGLQTSANKGYHHSPRTGFGDWKNVSNITSSPTSSSLHLPPSTPANTIPEKVSLIQSDGNTKSRDQRRAAVVDLSPASMEQQKHHSLPSRPDHKIRCLSPRLGSCMPGNKDSGPLVSKREDPTHQ